MKTKISALPLARYLIFGAVFSLCITACFNWSIPTEIHVYSLNDAQKKLAEYNFGDVGLSPENPLEVFVKFNIGDLSQPGNNYLRLIEIIGDSGLYVRLELTEIKMGGKTVFTSPPLNEAVKGMDKIVHISIPSVTTSIMSDKNGISPFFFYENLYSIYSSAFTPKVTVIGDNAFSSCKIKGIGHWLPIKTIGREAFRGCENISAMLFTSSLETIGDSAFYDCSALEMVIMKGTPPKLGDSVFLGSTPDTITFYIEPEHEVVYRAWLAENASKFNNNGEDIILDISGKY